MQLLNLELDHFTLFCPATGIQILSEDDCNEDAPSFISYWLGDFMTEPTIKHEKLKLDWQMFYIENRQTENREPNFSEIEAFLMNYPEPNWVIYKITNCGMSCGPIGTTVYKVLNMNATIE